MANEFNLVPSPVVYFGSGKISLLPSVIKSFGTKVLLITGEKSFAQSNFYDSLLEQLHKLDIAFEPVSVNTEPTPAIVDEVVKNTLVFNPTVVVAIRSEEHTSELQSLAYLVCRLLLEKKKKK